MNKILYIGYFLYICIGFPVLYTGLFTPMENKRRLVIKYIDKWTLEEGVRMPIYDTKVITTSHVKRYNNCLYRLADLSRCSRNLIDYLTDIMDDDNYIVSNKHTINNFLDVVSSANIVYQIDTVQKAFKELRDKNFLLPTKSGVRGYYQVNPAYFIKNDESKRAELIKLSLEFSAERREIELSSNINNEQNNAVSE